MMTLPLHLHLFPAPSDLGLTMQNGRITLRRQLPALLAPFRWYRHLLWCSSRYS